ncbi:hypothetical protein BDW22DRAFT_259731 [Trametopsis cervina]|nr:hypothetical protein BDW22DRAFT_259731 [Trametopsis cervina]
MSRPIVLWRKKATISSDEACTTITSYSLPRYIPGLYESQESIEDTNLLVYVPSLQSLCIRQLIPFPDQIYTLGNVHLTYEPPQASGDYDLLRELVPGFSYAYNAKDAGFLQYLDPRLWAVLVQLYTGLPETFRVHKLPLSDIYLPLLQQIPSTDRFALVTTLNLRGCSEVDDDTILELRDLHGLGALDLGATAITSWGMHRLAKTLARKPDEQDAVRRLSGPWALRVITLRDCMNVKNDVYESLQQFPLLSVIGEWLSTARRCELNVYYP